MSEGGIRMIIAGGGTGGHIFPAIAIANAVRNLAPEAEILFAGAKGKMEMDLVPQAGYRIEGLDIVGYQRKNWAATLSLPFKILRSLRQAARMIRDFKPAVVVGTGGYASFPVLWTAERKMIPVLIQEQNSMAGKSNRILGKKAARICVAYEGMQQFFDSQKILVTGNPVRALMGPGGDHQRAVLGFGLDPQFKTVLAMGGSLGAKSVNLALEKKLEEFRQGGLQLIWQTGKSFYRQALDASKGYEDQVKVFDFIRQMDQAYQAADVVISRAGALSISELCLVGKPAVLVPYPYAAQDHQTHNALYLVHRDAALMVKDSEAGEELVKKTLMLLENEKMQEILAANLSGLAMPDAGNQIAREVLKLAAQN
jgi:UDP-N-acetylglucosamine--N-acetylmuramyl-(pentapeptide) pyrophosphoryl-undecaprenol N-acetylglucosamine transferase